MDIPRKRLVLIQAALLVYRGVMERAAESQGPGAMVGGFGAIGEVIAEIDRTKYDIESLILRD